MTYYQTNIRYRNCLANFSWW